MKVLNKILFYSFELGMWYWRVEFAKKKVMWFATNNSGFMKDDVSKFQEELEKEYND